MKLSKRVGWIAFLGMAAVASIAASASAKKLMGALQDQDSSVPVGVIYTSGGVQLFSRPTAYKSDGTTDCGIRTSQNGVYLVSTLCSAAAVTYAATLQTLSSVQCSSAKTAWSGPIVACTKALNLTRSDNGDTRARVIAGIARGYN